MEEEPKIVSLADLAELNEIVEAKIGVTVYQLQERAYRKGCHQTAAMIYDAALDLKSREEVLSFIGDLEDVLAAIRGDAAPHAGLLDEAIRKALSLKK